MTKLTYTLEQLMEIGDFQRICNCFFYVAPNQEAKNKLFEILYEGCYNGFTFSTNMSNKDNPWIEIQRRISMADLFLRNPSTFEKIVENKINLFHGTNANALPSILKTGMNSIDESQRDGIDVITGENWSRMNGKRNFISFTDVLDLAEDYSTLTPSISNKKLSFEVVIGTDVNEALKAGTTTVHSDIPEVGIRNKLPLESIKFIGVPSSKVKFVRKLVGNSDIIVMPIDGLYDKFYYVDEMRISIFPDKLEKMKQELNKKRKDKIFSKKEIEEVSRKRMLPNIKKNLIGLGWLLKDNDNMIDQVYEEVNQTDGRKVK